MRDSTISDPIGGAGASRAGEAAALPRGDGDAPRRPELSVLGDVRARRTLGFLLHDSARLMRRRFVQLAREDGLDLNQSEVSILMHLSREEGMSQAALAARLDIQPIFLARLLRRLEAMRLVERRPHPSDRRVRTLWLLPPARPYLHRIEAMRLRVREEAMAGLPAATREVLLDALAHLRGNLIAAAAPAPSSTALPPEPPVPAG